MATLEPIEYIEIVEGRLGKKVRVVGTILTIDEIAAMHNNGCTVEWFLENYADLTSAKLYAALSYYYNHKDEIDARNQERNHLAEQVGTPLDELIQKGREQLR
jgi:uncharacterized protein (DUF433 family)